MVSAQKTFAHRIASLAGQNPGRNAPTPAGAGSDLAKRGQTFGFVLALIAFGGAIMLSVLGMPNVGSMFLSIPVLALIWAFVVRG